MLVFITCPLALYCFVCMYAKARYKCLIFGLSSCYSPVLSREGGLDEGLSSIFVHIVTNIYSKIKTDFYFAFSSLTLQAFTMIYFSYFSYFNYFSENYLNLHHISQCTYCFYCFLFFKLVNEVNFTC